MEINSRQNKLIKEVFKLHQHKYRQRQKRFLAEGRRLLSEALKSEKKIFELYYTSEFAGKLENRELIEKLKIRSSKNVTVTASVMNYIASVETPSGILAVLPIEDEKEFKINPDEHFIILDKVTDPGNAGAIMRNALAFGVKKIVLLKGCVDPFSSKVVRASAGAVFHLDLHLMDVLENFFDELKEKNIKIIGTKAKAENTLDSYGFRPPFGLVFGSEAHGLSKEVEHFIDEHISIPIDDKSDSLNVSVASGIILHAIHSA